MRKLSRIFLILIITFLLANIFNITYAKQEQGAGAADSGPSQSATDIMPGNFKPRAINQSDADKAFTMIGKVLGALRNISVIVSVIVLMVIGFKYIIGSVEEKANYKASMWPYIIGCIVAVAGTTLVDYIYKVVK